MYLQHLARSITMCELIGACRLSYLYLGLGGAGARRGSSGSCETVVRGRGGSPEKETEEAMKDGRVLFHKEWRETGERVGVVSTGG